MNILKLLVFFLVWDSGIDVIAYSLKLVKLPYPINTLFGEFVRASKIVNPRIIIGEKHKRVVNAENSK